MVKKDNMNLYSNVTLEWINEEKGILIKDILKKIDSSDLEWISARMSKKGGLSYFMLALVKGVVSKYTSRKKIAKVLGIKL